MTFILLLLVVIIVMTGVYFWYNYMVQNYNDQDLTKDQKKAKRFYNNIKLKNHE